MLFMSHYQILPGNRDAAIQRFAQTGGRPPKGVELIGRWHDLASGEGVSIYEADSVAAVAGWQLQWNDVMELHVQPVLTDEQLGAVLSGLQQK
jgi:hypothetical protein